MNRLRLPAAAFTTLALVMGALIAGPAAGASGAPPQVSLDGSTSPLVAATSEGMALVAGRDDTILDPAKVVFTAVAGKPATTRMLVDTSGAPDGVTVSELALSRKETSTPDGGSLRVVAQHNKTRVPWQAGGDDALDPTETDSLEWTFDKPGTFTVGITLTAKVTQSSAGTSEADPAEAEEAPSNETSTNSSKSGTTAASASSSEPVTLTTELTVEVSGSPQEQEKVANPEPKETAKPEPKETAGDQTEEPVSTPTAGEPEVGSSPTATAPTHKQFPASGLEAGPGEPLVVAAGNVALTPLFDAARVDLEAKEFTGFDLGVLDKTGDYADQKWHSASDTVIHISDANKDASSGLWSTPATVPDVAGYTTGDDARLLLGADAGVAVGGVNKPFQKAVSGNPRPQYALAGMTGPDNGRLRVFRADADLDTPTWDSSLLGVGQQPGSLDPPVANKATFYGFTFDQPGRYCVTVANTIATKASRTLVTEKATYTFYVGELPDSPTTCAQVGNIDDPDPGDDDDDDDPVRILSDGHLDIRTALTPEGKLYLGAQKSSSEGVIPSENLVLAGTHAGVVPEPTATSDLTFLGAPGTPYHYYPISGGGDGFLWPGFSTENFPKSSLAPEALVSFTLVGVRGLRGAEGGEVALTLTDHTLLDSRELPSSYTLRPLTHAHMNWLFNKTGQYCLNFETRAHLADGTWATGGGQLTVWTGDPAEADTVVSCDRLEAEPPHAAVPTTTLEPSHPHVVDSAELRLSPFLDGQTLNAAGSTKARVGAARLNWDLDDVIVSTDTTVRHDWVLPGEGVTSKFSVGNSTDRVPWADVDGLIEWSWGDIRGPGEVSMTQTNQIGQGRQFDTAAGITSSTVWPSITSANPQWSFTAPGVYCIPMTWSATLASTHQHVSTTKTLTVVAGSYDPADATYIDRSTVTTCSRGQQTTPPGGSEDPDDPGGDDLPDSDATVLRAGHVDIASQFEDGALRTRVKDSSSGEGVVYRDLGDVVFYADERSRTSIPAGASSSFLGRAGDPVWILPQVQDDFLLWPGWSTEEVPIEATKAGVDWRLTDITGPGEFLLFQEDSFGEPTVLFNTRDGISGADSLNIPKNTHAHGSWAFTAEGTYCLAFERSAALASGATASDKFVMAMAVGAVDPQKVDPSKCFSQPAGQPETADSNPISIGNLNDGNAGGVEVLSGDQGFAAGQLVTVQVGQPRAGQWVSVWLDDTAWLGWAQVGSSGAIQVRLPEDAAARAHVLVVKDRDGGLIGWDSLSVVAADTPGGGEDDPGGDEPSPGSDAVWNVANGTVNKAGATVLNNGHVDIASLLKGSTLSTRVKDTTQSATATFRDPAKTVLQLLPNARATVPSGSQWSFLGQAGSSFYQVTQTQQAGLLWPGWSTESIPSSATKSGVDWTLTNISGPGEFALYETGSFGTPTVMFNTRDGITGADRTTIPKSTHAHGNWAFGAQGNYCLGFKRSATLASGAAVSDRFVLAVAVGSADVMQVDPAKCFQAQPGDPSTTDRDPIADDKLTSASKGAVHVAAAATGVAPGQLVTIQVGAAYAGKKVSVWLHSTPQWLGWVTVDSAGKAQVRLPASTPLGSHKIVVKATDGALIGWDNVNVSAAASPPKDSGNKSSSGDHTPPAAKVPSTKCAAGATILSSGHIDYSSRIMGGKLESLIGDSTSGAKVYRQPSGTILWLKPSSRVKLPAGYGQIGAPGANVWQVPQTQNPDLIWLGWSTETMNAGNTRGPVTWKVNSIRGPGSVRVYLSGSFGGVQSMVFNNGGSYSIPLGVHAHANWAFSAEGIYRITTTQTATLANGKVSSDTETLTIAVGDVDPASAAGSGSGCGTIPNSQLQSDDQDGARHSAAQAAAAAAAAARGQVPGQGAPGSGGLPDPLAALAAGNPVPLLLSTLGGLLLVSAVGTGALWWRRRKDELSA